MVKESKDEGIVMATKKSGSSPRNSGSGTEFKRGKTPINAPLPPELRKKYGVKKK